MNNTDNTERTFSLETNLDRELALARLIDDELTAAQERELLKHLDAQPELWRSCALGFLEERALRRGTRGWVLAQETNSASIPLTGLSVPLARPVSPLTRQPETLAEPVARNTTSKRRTWLDYSTLAAGLLLAFGLGSVVSQYQSRPLPLSQPLAKEQSPIPAPPASSSHELVPSNPMIALDDAHIENPAHATDDADAEDAAQSNLRLQYVSNEGEPSDKEIDIPLIPVSKIDESMLESWEQATPNNPLPPEIQRWLEQEGQVVRQQNLWLTVELPNGQQALVPVQRIFTQPRHLLAQ